MNTEIIVLHIGIKWWPLQMSLSDNNVIGLRGGGMLKYNDILINSYGDNIKSGKMIAF